MEKMYDHFLDGKISEQEYDKRREGFKKKQVEIKSKLENLEETDDNYYTTCEYILKICQNAGQLFESSEPVVKRQILKLLVQDCVVDGVNLCHTIRRPFDMFAEGSSRLKWLPEMDAKHITQHQWVSLLVPLKKWRGPRGAKLIRIDVT